MVALATSRAKKKAALAALPAFLRKPASEVEEPRYRPIDWKLIRRLLSFLTPFKRRLAGNLSTLSARPLRATP